MINDEWYEVSTYWGWFRLDRGAYEDYLAGKLWITWVPGKRNQSSAEHHPETELPPNITESAILLRDLANKQGLYVTLQSKYPGTHVKIPYKPKMEKKPIHELALRCLIPTSEKAGCS